MWHTPGQEVLAEDKELRLPGTGEGSLRSHASELQPHTDHTAGVERGPGDRPSPWPVPAQAKCCQPRDIRPPRLEKPRGGEETGRVSGTPFPFLCSLPLTQGWGERSAGLALAWPLLPAVPSSGSDRPPCTLRTLLCSAPGLALERHRISGILAAKWGKTSYRPHREADAVFLAVGFASLFLDP